MGQMTVASKYYEIRPPQRSERDALLELLPELLMLPEVLVEPAITAWTVAVGSSTHTDLSRLPFGPGVRDYSLLTHVQEVTQTGLMLADYVEERWQLGVDRVLLTTILLMHDVDKPLLYQLDGAEVTLTTAGTELPHGVLGAILLRDLGFSEDATAIVATHAVYSPFHSSRTEGWSLHYADFFAADYVMRSNDLRPFYQGSGA